MRVDVNGESGREVPFFNARTGKRSWGPITHGCGGEVLIFSADGTQFITRGNDELLLWEYNRGNDLINVSLSSLVGSKSKLEACDASFGAGKAVMTSHVMSRPSVYSINGYHFSKLEWHRTSPPSYLKGAGDWTPRAYEMSFSPDGKYVVGVCNDRTIQIWEVASGKPAGSLGLSRIEPEGRPWIPDAVLFMPSGSHVLGAMRSLKGAGLRLVVWNINNGDPVFKVTADPQIDVLASSSDGELVAAGTHNGEVTCWSVSGESEIGSENVGDRVKALAFDEPSKRLAVGAAVGLRGVASEVVSIFSV